MINEDTRDVIRQLQEVRRITGELSGSEGLELADALRKKWKYVNYNSKTGEGRASMGMIKISWHESQNDPAVVVTVEPIRLKATARDVKKALDAISKIVGRV